MQESERESSWPSKGIASGFETWWSKEQRSPFPKGGFVTLDANVLLAMYRVTSGARKQILEVLERLQEKLWVPHQAALEFNRARTDAVAGRVSKFRDTGQSLRNATGNAVAELRSAVEKLVKLRRENMSERDWRPGDLGLSEQDLRARLQGVMDPALEELARLESEHDLSPSVIHSSDPILPLLEKVTRSRIGMPYNQETIYRLVSEATQFRYPNKIPPGYADAGKKSSAYLEAGDYILWRQILDWAGTLPPTATIAFVTLDTKEDWWLLDSKRKAIRGRPELGQEMSDLTGVAFETLTLSRFLQMAAAQFPGRVSEATVDEVKETEAESAMVIDLAELSKAVNAALLESSSNLLDLSPRKFDKLIADLFDAMGFETSVVDDSAGDTGVDIVVIDRRPLLGTSMSVVQAKRYRPGSPISAHHVRELYGTVMHSNADRGIFVTTSNFTNSAREFAIQHSISLIDGDELISMLRLHLDIDATIA